MIIYQALWDVGVTILMILQCMYVQSPHSFHLLNSLLYPQTEQRHPLTIYPSPIQAFWDSTIEGARCLDFRSSLLSTAALNTLSDFLVFLWPAHALWNVQLPVKQRIQLIIIFSMGCIVCIGGICRMWYIEVYFSTYDSFCKSIFSKVLAFPLAVTSFRTLFFIACSNANNGTGEGAIVWIIMSLEYTIGIICGCLPSVKPLLASLFPAIFGSSHPSHPSRSGAYGRSTHNGGRSWPLHSLTTHKSKDTRNGHGTVERVEEVDLSEAPTASVGYAWAISGRRGSAAYGNGEDGDRLVGVPKNGIKRDIVVETVVHDNAEGREGLGMGSEESREPSMRKGGDASSEEWIMSDGK